jgi:predicted permease
VDLFLPNTKAIIEHDANKFKATKQRMIDQDLLTFFLVSISSTLEVSVMVGIGVALSYVGFVNKTMIKHLSEVVLWVLTPCLLAHKFSTNVTGEIIQKAWPVLLFGILYQAIGYGISNLVFMKRIWGESRISDKDRSVLNSSVMFNNANSLPFLFVVALCRTGDVFHDEQAAANLAVAYVSVFLLPTRFTFWSYTLFAFKSDTKTKLAEETQTEKELENPKIIIEAPGSIIGASSDKEGEHFDSIDIEDDTSNNLMQDQMEEHVEVQTWKDKVKAFPWKKLMTAIVSPPIVGMMCGLFVGLIPQLKVFFVTDPPAVVSIFDHVASTFGGAMFPVSMMILGCNLYDTFVLARQTSPQNVQQRQGVIKRLSDWARRNIIKFNHPGAVLLSCLLRLVVMPLIGVGLTVAAYKIGMFQPNDPVILLVLLVEASTPAAMNLAIAVNLCDDPKVANAMTEILLFQYLISPITMALFATWYLSLACNLTGACLIQ